MTNFRFFNGTTTTQILAAALDEILIGPKGSVSTNASIAIVNSAPSLSEITVKVDGTVTSGATAISLQGVDSIGVGGNRVNVTATGFVQSFSDAAIVVSGTSSGVANDGVIDGKSGIYALGGTGKDVLNAGRITADFEGIRLEGDFGSVVNAGFVGVSAKFDNSVGIKVLGSNNTITNSGTLICGVRGLEVLASDNTVINSGHIQASEAVRVFGDRSLINNSGTIESQLEGLSFGGNDNVLLNSGSIVSAADVGLWISGKNWHVNNSGHVTSLNDDGVFFSGAAATTFKGFLRNSGTIEAGAIAVDLHFTDTVAAPGSVWFFNNSGHILGGNGGISTNVVPVILFNSGTISTAVGIAYQATGQSLITNRGIIEGGAAPIGPVTALQLGAGVDQLKNFGEIHGDVVMGSGADVVRNGGLIDGTLDLGDGNDSYDGRGGSVDVIVLGGGRNDTLKGGALDDTMSGDAGDDKLYGRGGDDSLTGGVGNDLINGGAGDDTIDGGAGNDTMNGGTGQDVMTGGAGADVFVFESTSAVSTGNAFDRIIDFQPGIDHVDLSAFGGLSFAFSFEFSLHFVIYSQETGLLQGDLNGDTVADFTLMLGNHPALTADDLLL